MSLSDSDSPLSSPPESEDELPSLPIPNGIIEKSPSPPPKRQRKPRTPRIPTFADLPEIAFIVAFQSRFHSAFKGVPSLGPQDVENGVINITPSEQVEQLLCRLLSLVLNRKKNVEKGHHSKALEEAIHANQSQWPSEWEGKSPLAGGKKFNDLDAKQRLVLLRYLILWALNSSESIRAILSDSYKTNRRNDDLNVPLSIQPWGKDGEKRKYYLIEGREDTPFRVYRESDPLLDNVIWESVAGTIDELKALASELAEDGTRNARELQAKMLAAIPRFEEGENKRKRRDYRQSRKAYFQQISAAYSYEGRTRGKRIKYAFSDDDERGRNTRENSELDESRSRRSGRSRMPTPSVPGGPRFTASGRLIKRPVLPYSSHATTPGHTTPVSVGSENGEPNSLSDGRTRKSSRQANYHMLLDDTDDAESYHAEDDEDDYEQGESDEGNDGDDSQMSMVSSDRECLRQQTLLVTLKFSTHGQVAQYLTYGKSRATPSFNHQSEEVDIDMKDIPGLNREKCLDIMQVEAKGDPDEEISVENQQNGLCVMQVLSQNETGQRSIVNMNAVGIEQPDSSQQLPVSNLPLQNTSVTEIRSKGLEVG